MTKETRVRESHRWFVRPRSGMRRTAENIDGYLAECGEGGGLIYQRKNMLDRNFEKLTVVSRDAGLEKGK